MHQSAFQCALDQIVRIDLRAREGQREPPQSGNTLRKLLPAIAGGRLSHPHNGYRVVLFPIRRPATGINLWPKRSIGDMTMKPLLRLIICGTSLAIVATAVPSLRDPLLNTVVA